MHTNTSTTNDATISVVAGISGIDAERQPVVFAKDGEVFASSRDVAAFFGKQHGHVMRDIDNLIKNEPSLGLSNFGETPYVEVSNGQTYRSYDMDRDGFTLLAMGFTGVKALKWKLKYIEAFKAMETEVLRITSAAPAFDPNDPVALRGLLLNYSEKQLQLEKQVEELKPSQQALNRISNSDDLFGVRVTAKLLQMQEKKFTQWIQSIGWAYRQTGTNSLLCYAPKQKAGYCTNKAASYTKPDGSDGVRDTLKFYPKGIVKLAQILNVELPEGDLFKVISEVA